MEHACHWPGCKGYVGPDAWGCEGCWSRLPERIQQPITDALRLRSLPMFYRANAAAVAWVKYTYDGVDPRPHDPGRWDRLCRMVATKDLARANVAGRKAPRVTLERLGLA